MEKQSPGTLDICSGHNFYLETATFSTQVLPPNISTQEISLKNSFQMGRNMKTMQKSWARNEAISSLDTSKETVLEIPWFWNYTFYNWGIVNIHSFNSSDSCTLLLLEQINLYMIFGLTMSFPHVLWKVVAFLF